MYTFAGAGLAFVLVLVTVIGIAGVAGIGILTPGEAFFVLGASTAVLSLAVVGLLFSMDRTLGILRKQQATIDALQDERFRAVEEEQRRTDRRQENDIAQLRSSKENRRPSAAGRDGVPRKTPFGDIHRVIDVEGIGEEFSDRLAKLDIVDTEQLWKADPSAVANQLDVPEKTVRSWQAMAELMALKHVGPQYAELLVRADIASIPELARMEPDRVALAVQGVEQDREVRVQGNPISDKHTRAWVQAARKHDPEAMRMSR